MPDVYLPDTSAPAAQDAVPHLRRPGPDDAEAYCALLRACDRETDFLLFSGDDRPIDLDKMTDVLARGLAEDDPFILCAWDGDRPIGYVSGGRIRAAKRHHTIAFGIAVLREAWGRGIGSRLLTAFEAEAVRMGISRLEMSVMAINPRAQALYRRFGYQIEGVKRQAICLDGELVDEIAMAKLVSS